MSSRGSGGSVHISMNHEFGKLIYDLWRTGVTVGKSACTSFFRRQCHEDWPSAPHKEPMRSCCLNREALLQIFHVVNTGILAGAYTALSNCSSAPWYVQGAVNISEHCRVRYLGNTEYMCATAHTDNISTTSASRASERLVD